jgi:HAD superfamily hydrolase (TIGR01509 family)
MIRAVFWDNDGVLVDTERLYFSATRHVLATVGITLTKESFVELVLVQGKGAFQLAKDQGFSSGDIENLREKRNSLYSQFLAGESTVIDGVKEVLETLNGHYRMAVVTSSRRDHFDIIHRSSDLLKYFDFVLTGNDFKKYKPDPEPYLLAIEKSGCRKEECIAVEDSERGLHSAKSAGIQCIVIPNELTRTGNFSSADFVAENIRDLVKRKDLFPDINSMKIL